MRTKIIALLIFLFALPAFAQDWSKPDLASSKTGFMTEMHDLLNQCAKQDFTTGTNIPTGALRYNRTSDLWQEYDGATWATAPISATALGGSGITSAMITDGTITSADIGDGQVASADITDGTIVAADIAGSTITGAKIASGTIESANILDGTVSSADILNETIVSGDIANGTIASTDIADGTVTGTDISDGSVGTLDIGDGTIAAADIADGQITSAKITDGTIATADIADNQITSEKIDNGTIVSADIADGTITGSDLADSSISGSTKVTTGWVDAAIDSGTMSNTGSAVDASSETGTYRYMRIGTTIYFYVALSYTASGTGDTTTLRLPSTAANTEYSFFCMVSSADIVIAYPSSTTQAILKKTSGNYGTGAGRTMRCSGFYEG